MRRDAVGYGLGIDLGTTWTAAAVVRDGRAEVVSLRDHAPAVPSVLFFRVDGSVLVGDAAVRRGLNESDRVAREFKRRLGDTTPLILGGTPWSAEALTARLLRWVVDEVVTREGGPPDAVVVTHPANWGPYKIELMTQALRLADLPDATMLTEPAAAARYYAVQERVEAGSVVAVYDLGGGTFDATVLRKAATGFEVLGRPEGIERMGGIDIDAAVLSHVLRALGPDVDGLDADDPTVLAAFARVRQECVAAKEALSHDTDVEIPVLLPGVATDVRLTRAELEAMIRPALGDTVATLRRAVTGADLGVEEVSRVLLVGGSSRIPLVAQLVAAELGRPVVTDAHPKFAVALGAAMAADPLGVLDGLSAGAAPARAAPVGPPPAAPAPPRPPAPPLPVARPVPPRPRRRRHPPPWHPPPWHPPPWHRSRRHPRPQPRPRSRRWCRRGPSGLPPTPPPPAHSAPSGSTPVLPWVAGTVAVVVLLVAGLGVVLLRDDGDAADPATPDASVSTLTSALPLSVDWELPLGDDVFSSPAVAGGSVLVGAADGALHAVDAATGVEQWSFPTAGPVRSSPVVVGDAVAVGSDDGALYEVGLADHDLRWKAQLDYEIVSSPATDGEVVVVGADGLYAFDARTGEQRWRYATDDLVTSSPVIVDGTAVVGSSDGAVHGVDASSGEGAWTVSTDGAVLASPFVADGRAYVGSAGGTLYGIDVGTGEVVLEIELGARVNSSPVVVGDVLVVGTSGDGADGGGGSLVALDLGAGAAEVWRIAVGPVDSSPAVSDGVVAVGTSGGDVLAVSLDDGRVLGRATTGGPVLSSPVFDGDRVYVGSSDGVLRAISGWERP